MSEASAPTRKKRVKWEPWALMILVAALGAWLVLGPNPWRGPVAREGARLVDLKVGTSRGVVEVMRSPAGDESFRILLRNGFESKELSAAEFKATFGDEAYTVVAQGQRSPLLKFFNITSWTNLVWVGIGLLGQLAFSGRMLIQWLVSEKKRESVVPELFWWLSLGGGVMLFAYFVWRQDFVGVLGQSSGVVIYARNIRLIYKRRRMADAESAT